MMMRPVGILWEIHVLHMVLLVFLFALLLCCLVDIMCIV